MTYESNLMSTDARTNDNRNDRFEFRIFRRMLGSEAAVLTTIAGAGRTEASVDRYVVSRRELAAGLKLRGGQVELKLLARTVGGLEQWHAEEKVPLPASGSELEPVLRALDVPAPKARIFADGCEFAAWVADDLGNPVAVLRKRRQHFLLPGVTAEIGEILLDGTVVQTLALEGTRPEAVAAVAARLGLAAAVNTSFPRFLSGRYAA